MSKSNKKNVAVITGASSGIGREFVMQLLNRDDIDEFWAIARDNERLEELKNGINKTVKIFSLDLSVETELLKYKEELERENVNIKFLVNCNKR